MRKLVIAFLFFTASIASGQAEDLVLKGVFQGKNLIISNPFASTGVGFCIYEVTINGEISTDEINSSSFEIDLTLYDLQEGDKVTIVIKHKSGCNPKVLNQNVLKPKSSFTVTDIELDTKTEILKWKTVNENGKLPFYVEQFKWNKWVRVTSVEGKGTKELHSYSAKVKLNSNKNRFRVKQIDYSRKPRYSKEVIVRSLKPEVTFEKKGSEILFSAATNYELYDSYGKIKTKGYGTKINISRFKKGEYFLNYDTKTTTFKK